MDRMALLEQLQRALVVQVEHPALPDTGNVGLIVVDVVQGFTRRGNLSDPRSMGPMVDAVDRLVRRLGRHLGPRLRLLLLRDCHDPHVPEPPYPPHCLVGSGEEQIDPKLEWLTHESTTVVMDKDCINGFVGAMQPVATDQGPLWRHRLVDWVLEQHLESLVLAGDCTDICVSDLAVALLSARNHGMLTRGHAAAFPIYVHVPSCATFDLDPDGALAHNELRHPGPIAQHVGLWVMASRGARLVEGFTGL